MIYVSGDGAIKSKLFYGSPQEVEEQLSAFLNKGNVQMHWLAQSQSSDNSGEKGTVVVTVTIIFSEQSTPPKEVTGFKR